MKMKEKKWKQLLTWSELAILTRKKERKISLDNTKKSEVPKPEESNLKKIEE